MRSEATAAPTTTADFMVSCRSSRVSARHRSNDRMRSFYSSGSGLDQSILARRSCVILAAPPMPQTAVATPERALPHNLEAEKSVLGAILIHNEAFNHAAELIDS